MLKHNLAGLALITGLVLSGSSLVAVADKDDHPQMEKALHALENAKEALQHSDHDFQGHRTRALEMTNQAIDEIHAALHPERNLERRRR